MRVERNILKALQTATTAAVAASDMPTLPVKYINRTEPENGGKWLEIVHIPNNVSNQFWSEGETYRGQYRLILHWPPVEEGPYTPLDVLASICAHFPIGTLLENEGVRVKITSEPDLTGVIEAAPELLFPATIRYETSQL